MKHVSRYLVLISLSVVSGLITYCFMYSIARNFFFDKLFYKKSADFGYFEPNLNVTEWKKRNKDIFTLNTPETSTNSADEKKYYHIAILGDSYVFGLGIKNEERFALILEKKLNRIRPTKVISLSDFNSSPINYVAWVNDLRLRTYVDLYIFPLVNNDAYIQPNRNLTSFDTDNIVKNCQSTLPQFKPTMDVDLILTYKNQNKDLPSINEIADIAFKESWTNPINLCVLNNSLKSLPSDNAIYFITDNYLGDNPEFSIYQSYLDRNHKFVLSSSVAKYIQRYSKYWQKSDFSNFQVSRMERHPSVLANQMYTDVLYNEIINNPKWQFNPKK